jgi:hypothetical protein
MSTITLVNRTRAAAVFRLSRAGTPVGEIAVGGGGYAVVPQTDGYVVRARALLSDGNTYGSGSVSFWSSSRDVVAQVQQRGGTFVFQLAERPGSRLSTIGLTNDCRAPVRFDVDGDGSSLGATQVVAPCETGSLSTDRVYAFTAVVDGITTASVIATSANPVVTVTATTNPVADFTGYTLECV